MTVDIPAMLRNPEITIADLEEWRDKPLTQPYAGEITRAIAEAARAEINRRRNTE
ncbi:hypothetical protein ACWDHW_08685 [Streptomyces melanosporofaciens]